MSEVERRIVSLIRGKMEELEKIEDAEHEAKLIAKGRAVSVLQSFGLGDKELGEGSLFCRAVQDLLASADDDEQQRAVLQALLEQKCSAD